MFRSQILFKSLFGSFSEFLLSELLNNTNFSNIPYVHWGSMARHHIIISGTGRAGTTFLVQLLTELGLDTGFPKGQKIDQNSSAGLELDLRSARGCRVGATRKATRFASRVFQMMAQFRIFCLHIVPDSVVWGTFITHKVIPEILLSLRAITLGSFGFGRLNHNLLQLRQYTDSAYPLSSLYFRSSFWTIPMGLP